MSKKHGPTIHLAAYQWDMIAACIRSFTRSTFDDPGPDNKICGDLHPDWVFMLKSVQDQVDAQDRKRAHKHRSLGGRVRLSLHPSQRPWDRIYTDRFDSRWENNAGKKKSW